MMRSGNGEYKIIQSITYKKITLQDEKVVWVKQLDPEASIVLCDDSGTIHEYRNNDLVDEYDRIGEEIGKDAQKSFLHDIEAQWRFVNEKPLCGEAAEIKRVIQAIQEVHNNVFCIVSFTEFPELLPKTLEEKIGIDADYIICNLSDMLHDRDENPTFTVIQNPNAPKQHLILIVTGCPRQSMNHTKMEFNHHIDWAIRLSRQLYGLNAYYYRMILVDDEERHIEAAKRVGLNVIEVKAGTTEHWNELLAKSLELRLNTPAETGARIWKSVICVLGGAFVGFGISFIYSGIQPAVVTAVGGASVFIAICTIAGAVLFPLALMLINRYRTGHFSLFPPGPVALQGLDSQPVMPVPAIPRPQS